MDMEPIYHAAYTYSTTRILYARHKLEGLTPDDVRDLTQNSGVFK